MSDAVTAGIDVSKDHLDVAARPGGAFRVPNDPDGVADPVARLRAVRPSPVVLEATGGYEAAALAALLAAGVPAAAVNPRRVRQFASGIGQGSGSVQSAVNGTVAKRAPCSAASVRYRI